jgi:hypothetical protein
MDSNRDSSWEHVAAGGSPHDGMDSGGQPSGNVPVASANAEMHRAMSATDVASACSRIVDLKQLCAPPVFDSDEQHWQVWKYCMENLFVLTGISKACTWALTSEKMDVELEVMPKEYEGIAIFLHAVLAQFCAGDAGETPARPQWSACLATLGHRVRAATSSSVDDNAHGIDES